MIDKDTGYHLVGPFDETSLRKVEESIRYRDALIMQDVLDGRLAGRQASRSAASGSDRQSGALLFALLLNQTLPERFRLDDNAILWRQSLHDRLSLRRLLKETYAAWKAAGVPAKRGMRFADIGKSRRTLGFMFDLHRAVSEKRVDLDALVRGEFNDDALDLVAKHGLEAS